jgi:hypothetical protein
VTVLGHNHLAKMGLNISCMHRTNMVMDCANLMVTGYGVVLWMRTGTIRCNWQDASTQSDGLCDRKRHWSPIADSTEEPKMFPMIGEFGGVEQCYGSDRLRIDSKFNVKYIATDPLVDDTRPQHDEAQLGMTSTKKERKNNYNILIEKRQICTPHKNHGLHS